MRSVLAVTLLLLSFVFGICVGVYHLPAFDFVKKVKNSVLNHDNRRVASDIPYDYWKDRTSLFELIQSNNRIIMLGDSLTDRGEWSELFNLHLVSNRGIDGDTTVLLAKRLDHIIRSKPKKVFLMIGINDLGRGRSPESVFNNIVNITRTLKKNDIEVIVQSILKVGKRRKKRSNKDVISVNSKLQNYCSKNDVIFVDLNRKLAPNGYLNEEYTNDGLHLNGNGYIIWAKTIKKYTDAD